MTSFFYVVLYCHLLPLFKPQVSLLKLPRQSSCGSNFYRTFMFIWLSLIQWIYRGVYLRVLAIVNVGRLNVKNETRQGNKLGVRASLGLSFCGMWHRVIGLGACQHFEGTTIICSYCSPNDTASPPRRAQWAEAPMWEPEIGMDAR